MRKLLVTALFLLFVGSAFGQNLYTETYSTVIRDTITIAGSTNQGSDWFKNKDYKTVFVEIYNNGFWYSAKLLNCNYTKFAVNWGATDSTLYVVGYSGGSQSEGVSVMIPFSNINAYSTSTSEMEYIYKWSMKHGDGTLPKAVSPMFIRFRGSYQEYD
jgi:hypothetical protein